MPGAVGAQGFRTGGGGLRRRRRIPALTDAARSLAAQVECVARRFLAYGLFGWALEVAFTGATDGVKLRDRRLRGHSYLWMLPIYGGGGLLLETLRDRLASRGVPRWARSLAYMLGIYGAEFGSAALLDRATGDVPWRYVNGFHLRGYVRLDYAPFWYACGWLFEDVERELRKLDRPGRRTWRRGATESRARTSKPAFAGTRREGIGAVSPSATAPTEPAAGAASPPAAAATPSPAP